MSSFLCVNLSETQKQKRAEPSTHHDWRLYLPSSLLAAASISFRFFLCISLARSLMSSASCVSGNPMSQYPGGVFARSQWCR